MSDSPSYRGTLYGVGLIDRSERIRLSISGPDRAKFLHNLTTNEVKKLLPFQGREAFVTSLQGKTLGFITVHATQDRLIVRTDPAAAVLVLPHFQKYGLFDEIQLDDETGETFEYHLAGPNAEQLVGSLSDQSVPSSEYGIVEIELNSDPIRIIREAPTGRPGFTLIGPLEAKAQFDEKLMDLGKGHGLVSLDSLTFDTLRIEAGMPVFGRDITEKNLPQELGRDNRAISFVKGCYLGQETVARIDALGHVNQMIRGFRTASPGGRFEPGDLLKLDGKQVGQLTSTAFSPGWDRWIALGYLRETAYGAGAPLAVSRADGEESGQAVVCELPMLPPTIPQFLNS